MYNWEIGVGGFVHEAGIEVRADNASSQGLPFPERWLTAFRCRDLGRRAADVASAVETCGGITGVECEVIGVPKPQLSYEPDTGIGDIVSLRTPAGRMQFVFCAHVHGDEWYCNVV